MATGRERYKKGQSKTKRKINLGSGKILFFIFLIGILAYGIYTYIGFSNIKSENPLRNSNSDYYLLSDKRDALEKTLIVFEEEYNEKEVIKYVYMYAVIFLYINHPKLIYFHVIRKGYSLLKF